MAVHSNLQVAQYFDSLQRSVKTYGATRCKPLNHVVTWLRLEASAHHHDDWVAVPWRKVVVGRDRVPQ